MRIGLARLLTAALLAFTPISAKGREPLQQRVEQALRVASPGTRFGLVVATADGRELVAVNPEGRFIPASNTKILTTAAAFSMLPAIDRPDTDGGTAAWLQSDGRGPPDVVLEGRGDTRLSSAADCVADCLAALADAVAARIRRVGDIVGDDRRFADERWSPGMSWNNMAGRYGTGISALTLDGNELHVTVSPGSPGRPPRVASHGYYRIDNRAVTVASGEAELAYERLPGSNVLLLTGTVPQGGAPQILRLGIDDPAHFAAWRFRQLLEQRGVRVRGEARARHRPLGLGAGPPAAAGTLIGRLVPPPLEEDIRTVNKESQNVHAELLLRRLGTLRGSGRIEDGIAAVDLMLASAGVPKAMAEIHDGSGMSSYNRFSPRGMVRLLRWVDSQGWGARWRSTLPIAGVDGTLARRFKGTALESRLTAKTGTLNASNALAGYFTAASGERLLFAAYANDIPFDASATAALDAALVAIAAEN